MLDGFYVQRELSLQIPDHLRRVVWLSLSLRFTEHEQVDVVITDVVTDRVARFADCRFRLELDAVPLTLLPDPLQNLFPLSLLLFAFEHVPSVR